jgi:DNA (cytosine-5)-methyltransferase 1
MGIPSPPAILLPDGALITPDIRDAERLQGFPESWTNTPHGATDGHRFNQRRRWLLVGNAVNVEVSKWVGKRLAEPRRYDGVDGVPLPRAAAWPAAAWFDGYQRYAADLSTWPVRRQRKPLASFLRYEGSPLSLRATSGFYGRICASSLRFKPGFKTAVAKHMDWMSRTAASVEADKGKHRSVAYAA